MQPSTLETTSIRRRSAPVERAPLAPALTSAKGGSALLNVSPRTFYKQSKKPGFPKARLLGDGSVRWLVSELMAYIEALPLHQHQGEPPQLTAGKAARRGAGTPAPGSTVHRCRP